MNTTHKCRERKNSISAQVNKLLKYYRRRKFYRKPQKKISDSHSDSDSETMWKQFWSKFKHSIGKESFILNWMCFFFSFSHNIRGVFLHCHHAFITYSTAYLQNNKHFWFLSHTVALFFISFSALWWFVCRESFRMQKKTNECLKPVDYCALMTTKI